MEGEGERNCFERLCSKRGYALYCLAMFCFCNFLDQSDKWALPTLQSAGLQCASCGSPGDPHYDSCREHCLLISDFEMGLLVGPAFSFTTLLLSFPMGCLADRYNRVILLTLAVVVWSCATVLSAFTTEFWELLILRVLLGVGQCVVYPCALSMIADLFYENRSLYVACFSCMIYVGQTFGFSAGAISYATSWRFSFICLGVPGLIFSIPLYTTVREPERGGSEKGKVGGVGEGKQERKKGGEKYGRLEVEMEEMGEVVEWNEEKEGGEEVRKEGEEGEGEQKVGGSDLEEEIAEMFSSSPSLNSSFSVSPATPTTTPSTTWWGLVGEGVRDIKEVASYLPFFLVCFSCLFKYIAAYSAAAWGQVYFKRVHHVQVTGEVLVVMMLIPVIGALSSAIGSYVGDRFAQKYFTSLQSGKIFFCALTTLIGSIVSVFVFLIPSAGWAFTLVLFCIGVGEMWFPLCASTCLDVTHPSKRSIATSLFLAAACVGSVGTLLVGWLNVMFGVVIDGYSVGHEEADIPYDPTLSLLIVYPGFSFISSICFLVASYFLHNYHAETLLRVAS